MRCLVSSLFVLALASCVEPMASQRVVLVGTQLLDDLPSGSGLALYEGRLYVVSDDAPKLFYINLESGQQTAVPIVGRDQTKERESKERKADLESAVVFSTPEGVRLLAFGSGSIAPQRENILILNPRRPEEQHMLSATALYRYLRSSVGIGAAQWNLEGVAIVNDSLVLLNRGSNSVIIMSVRGFWGYLFEAKQPPPVRHYVLELPAKEGHQPRVSGACSLNDEEVLFTASIEDTPNWYTDGPVIGSGVGVFDLATGRVRWFEMLVGDDGKPLKEKLESVEVLSRSDQEAEIVTVADNDDGNSKLFRLRIRL